MEKIIHEEIVLTDVTVDTNVAAIVQQVATLIYADVTA